MKTLGWVRQQVVDWIEDDSDRGLLNRAINVSIDSVAKECSFSQLRTEIVVTPDSDGVILTPPRCQDIIDIYPSDETANEADFTFKGTRRVQTYPRTAGYFFRSKGVVESSLADMVCDFVSGSATVTQADSSVDDFTVDMIGEEFAISGGNETYKITEFDGTGINNTITIYPKYRWSTATNIPAVVRPEDKEKLVLFDSLGNIYTGDVVVEYQQNHPYLVSDADILIIPACNTVALEAVRFILRQTKYDVDAERLQAMYIQYKASECSKQPVTVDANSRPHDTLFSPPGRGRNGYSSRQR